MQLFRNKFLFSWFLCCADHLEMEMLKLFQTLYLLRVPMPILIFYAFLLVYGRALQIDEK